MNLQSAVTLHNGVQMPWVGLGVYKVENGGEVVGAVRAAIEHGYRSVDTASVYRNEEGVGQGIREGLEATGLSQEDLFITSKVWNTEQGYENTLAAFDATMRRLGLDVLDLYLIHWPGTSKFKETWRAMEKLYQDGRVRAIGVSNFQVHHLQDLMKDAKVVPMVNQVEFHPRLTQKELLAFCRDQGIQMEAWSPLMRGQLLDHPLLGEMAARHGKTVPQVILRWDLQHGVVTIPKSVKRQRIEENANIFDFELTGAEMEAIDGLNEDRRVGPDPDQFF